MTHVTPQTALDMRNAGIQQQPPIAGNFCARIFDKHIFLVTSLSIEPPGYWVQGGMYGGNLNDADFSERFVLLPTAEDILQELSAWYYLCWLPESSEWACIEADSYGRTLRQYRNTNAAEACASAYLDKHPIK